MHGGGKSVVGRLRHVDVIIGVNWFFVAYYSAGKLDGPIGDDFVDVHVGLRATAGLPDAQREMVVQFARNDFISGLDDQLGLFCWKLAEVLIDERRGFFEDAEGADELGGHSVFADGKVNQRARSLGAVVTVGGNFHFAHAVGFGAGVFGL